MISLHATRPARIARRTSWRRDPVTGGGELETYSPFSVSMGQALWVIMIIAGPPLILMLVVGLVISMVQAATSINEQTVSFVPKLLALLDRKRVVSGKSVSVRVYRGGRRSMNKTKKNNTIQTQ